MNAKYADVVSEQEVLAYIAAQKGKNHRIGLDA
jgi:hypothetical protein